VAILRSVDAEKFSCRICYLRPQVPMRDPKIVHNNQPLEELGGDEYSIDFRPWPPKVLPKVTVLNALHHNRNRVIIFERFQKLDEVLRVLCG